MPALDLPGLLSEVEAEYRGRTTKSGNSHTRATAYLPGGDTRSATFLHPYPLYFDYGDGAHISDVDGNEYLDFANNWASLVVGHAHRDVVAAIQRQAQRGSAWSGASRLAVDLADLLCGRVGSLERLRFANSGTEAVMLAARAARAFTGRNKVARAMGSYHGSHEVFDMFGEPAFIQDRGIQALRVIEFEFNNLQSVTDTIEQHHEELAAIIVEPFLTNGRVLLPVPGFLEHLRAETRKHGVLLIFDEVVTFRTSRGGAQESFDISPDLTTLGKIIGGGYPVGAFGGRRDVMDLFSPYNDTYLHHSGTFNGNPMTMTAGIETLRLYDGHTIEALSNLGDRLCFGISRVSKELHASVEVTGKGSLVYVEFKPDIRLERSARSLIRRIFLMDLLNQGVVTCAPGAMFALSTAMSEHDVDDAIHKVSITIERLERTGYSIARTASQ